MTTIYDVAKYAGVSAATVSRVINGSAKVSPEKVMRVKEAIKALGYHPSSAARSLRTNSTGNIGLIISDIAKPFLPEVVRGAEDCAAASDYNIFVVNTDNKVSKALYYFKIFLQKNVDGIVYSGLLGDKEEEEFVRTMLSSRKPIIFIDRYLPKFADSYVVSDNYAGAFQATTHLLKLGHRNICFVGFYPKTPICQHRVEGYRAALITRGVKVKENLMLWAEDLSFQEGYCIGKKILKIRERPSAIFATSDLLALGILQAIKDLGLRVPDDISLVGFDDIEVSSLVEPPLTTVRQHRYRMGYQAVEILLEAIRLKEKPTKKVILPTELVIRKSTLAIVANVP